MGGAGALCDAERGSQPDAHGRGGKSTDAARSTGSAWDAYTAVGAGCTSRAECADTCAGAAEGEVKEPLHKSAACVILE